LFKIEWDKTKLIKFNWETEFFDILIRWDYAGIQFEEWGKWQLFRKEWWLAIKFDWKTKFYNMLINWDYVEIQFEEFGKWQLFKIKWDKVISIKFDW
jgi:hypothetical protein